MAAKRWREVKSQKSSPKATNPTDSSPLIRFKDFSLKRQLQLMRASERIKAFITDMFMINMPLLYLTTYVLLDGKEAFTHNQWAILACGVGYGVITSLFLSISGQTPGFRYMGIRLAGENGGRLGFLRTLARYVLWVLGTSFLFGLLFGLIRRDGRCLHDVICGAYIIKA